MSNDIRATLELLRAEIGRADVTFDDEALQGYAAMLDEIRKVDDVALDAIPLGPGQWRVAVSAMDKLGILSVITGVFAVRDVHILSGEIFTIKNDAPTASARPSQPKLTPVRRGKRAKVPRRDRTTNIRSKILDVFDVQTDDSFGPESWDDLEEELRSLIGIIVSGGVERARAEIIDQFAKTIRDDESSAELLLPISIHFDTAGSQELTGLHIEAADTPGFVFAFSNALAMLDVNIARVRIRTEGGLVQDSFWVADTHGRKIAEEERLNEIRLAAALIKQFTHLLPRAPNPAQALKQFGALTRQLLSRPEWFQDIQTLASVDVLGTIAELMGASQFLWEDFLRMQHANLFPVLHDIPALDDEKSKGQLAADFSAELSQGLSPEDGLSAEDYVRRLNELKDREMFRIDLRHITQRIGFARFSDELSDLAEVAVQAAVEFCYRQVADQHGEPRTPNGSSCGWCLAALGKSGGRELGFASDIELVFVFEEEGESDGSHAINNSQFYEELMSRFLGTLSARQEGIFQIDLRLRPYGRDGTLASSLDRFCNYFSASGDAEQFERMALVKLRPVAGSVELAQHVLDARDRFVYSGEPLDYGNILHLRQRQAKELVPPGSVSAKHSPGGLVDVEYFVQANQIEAGSSAPQTRVTNTLQALSALGETGKLPARRLDELRGAYAFLRRLIDALRAVRGHAKDLTIPVNEPRRFDYLARRLRYVDPAALRADIDSHMRFAAAVWDGFQ